MCNNNVRLASIVSLLLSSSNIRSIFCVFVLLTMTVTVSSKFANTKIENFTLTQKPYSRFFVSFSFLPNNTRTLSIFFFKSRFESSPPLNVRKCLLFSLSISHSRLCVCHSSVPLLSRRYLFARA